MMFAVHTRRLQPHSGTGALNRVLDFLMWSEPYVAASFLFIAGTSLVLSHRKHAAGWLGLLGRRALLLYLLGIALFVPQFGIAWPDLLVSPGILSAIGVSMLMVGILVDRAAPDWSLGALALGILAATFWLDSPGRSVPGLDAGPGGLFPLAAFTCWGAWLARLRERSARRVMLGAILAAAIATVLVWQSGADWTTTEISHYPAHSGQLALRSLFDASALEPVAFWNHSALGALGLAFPLALSLALAFWLPTTVTGSKPLAPVRLLGRHALAAYVVHLGILGLLDLSGLGPKSAAATWLLILALGLVTTLLAAILDGSSPIARAVRRAYSAKGFQRKAEGAEAN